MEITLLNDIVIIFALSVAVLFVCDRLKVPSIVGYILTGILAGPHGLGLIRSVREVEILAEVGIVLLLFAIGIEFSFKNLLRIKKSVLMGGSLQVVSTVLISFVGAMRFGLPVGKAVFIGFLISLSSTAIVLKLVQERAEVDTPHGRTSLAILIFQDVIVVPMILVAPLLAGEAGDLGKSLFILALKGIGIVSLVILCAKWVIPRLLYQITRTRSRELFLLCIVLICFAVAWVTSRAGLSLALGAFLAGLVISESEYSHQALGNILPFRDVFTSFFFVSIGMLLDLGFLFQQYRLILLIASSVLILKSLTAGGATTLLGFPLRTAILTGLALSQVGEFSFILSKTGVAYGLLESDMYQIFLSVSVLTMAVTPFITALAPHAAQYAEKLPVPERVKAGLHYVRELKRKGVTDHLVIIGFGLNGKNLARAAKVGGIPYVIIEMNPETVKDERAKGEPIYYGDATQEAVLKHAEIKEARIVVAAVSDAAATRRIIEITRRLNPKVHIIVRTRYLHEMDPLYILGANEVIPEDYETSVEIFSRVLRKYLVPSGEIDKFIAEVRADGYEIFRKLSGRPVSVDELKVHLPDVEISPLRVCKGSSLIGKTLAQIELRRVHEISVLAIRRDEKILSNPGGDMRLCADDVVYIIGQAHKVAEVASLFHGPTPGR